MWSLEIGLAADGDMSAIIDFETKQTNAAGEGDGAPICPRFDTDLLRWSLLAMPAVCAARPERRGIGAPMKSGGLPGQSVSGPWQ